jgi:aminoglycoside/choline kinase family phosphotransferase
MPEPAATAATARLDRMGFAARPRFPSPRHQAMDRFLKANGWNGAVPVPLAADASFRAYFRLRRGDDSAVVMDAPPPQEDVGPYVAVAAILRRLGLSAPEVLAEDRAKGFLLIEDFGDDTYTRLLQRGADEPALYTLAIDVLAALQHAAAGAPTPDLPQYDEERLLAEAVLLVDWYLPAVLGVPPSIALREEYLALWRAVLPLACEPFRPTLVLRDFHVDNLMLLPGRAELRRCGLLDFQDAVVGPPAYDLVSLLEDARRDVPEALRRAMTGRYLAAFPDFDRADFARAAAILAAQRNCKILGIFTRLWRRDGKPAYLGHIPRLWRLVAQDLRHPALAGVARWFDRHLPPEVRRIPDLPRCP